MGEQKFFFLNNNFYKVFDRLFRTYCTNVELFSKFYQNLWQSSFIHWSLILMFFIIFGIGYKWLWFCFSLVLDICIDTCSFWRLCCHQVFLRVIFVIGLMSHCIYTAPSFIHTKFLLELSNSFHFKIVVWNYWLLYIKCTYKLMFFFVNKTNS